MLENIGRCFPKILSGKYSEPKVYGDPLLTTDIRRKRRRGGLFYALFVWKGTKTFCLSASMVDEMLAALNVPLLKDTGFYTFTYETCCDGRENVFASCILRRNPAYAAICHGYLKSITLILIFLALM